VLVPSSSSHSTALSADGQPGVVRFSLAKFRRPSGPRQTRDNRGASALQQSISNESRDGPMKRVDRALSRLRRMFSERTKHGAQRIGGITAALGGALCVLFGAGVSAQDTSTIPIEPRHEDRAFRARRWLPIFVARIIQHGVGQILGQQTCSQSAGAAGMIGTEKRRRRAAPDCYRPFSANIVPSRSTLPASNGFQHAHQA